MSSEKNSSEHSETMPKVEKEAVVENSTPPESPTDSAAEKPKRRFGLWLLLLAGAVAVATFFAPQPFKDRYLTPLSTWFATTESDTLSSEPAPGLELETALKSAVSEQPITATEIRLDDSATTPAKAKTETPAVESKPGASKEEISRMLDAMSALQEELQSLRQQQSSIKQAQHADQIMQLRTRLRWITNRANHLPQIGLAWEEVSLMPVLTSAERQKAQKMQTLAEVRLQELQLWQQKLSSDAALLTREEHANIIPTFETEWLNWIAGQFSIRRSLSQEELQDAQLRDQMLNVSRSLEIEKWPDAKAWLQMRATLQLRKVAAAGQDPATTADLELPESFNAIKNDIAQLRQEAATWLEQLQ